MDNTGKEDLVLEGKIGDGWGELRFSIPTPEDVVYRGDGPLFKVADSVVDSKGHPTSLLAIYIKPKKL